MENVNYCKQLIDLGEEYKVLFLQLLVWSEFLKKKKGKEMIREKKRMGREKLETIESYKFSFKGSREMKL